MEPCLRATMDKEPPFISQHMQYPGMEQEGLEEEETSESHNLLGNGQLLHVFSGEEVGWASYKQLQQCGST